MRSLPRVASLTLPLRPRPAIVFPRQWRQRAWASDDSKLHPNPKVVPSTDPQSPRPDANPARSDHRDPASDGGRAGYADPEAQGNMDPKGPNMDQLPHISEESAAIGKSMGTGGPSMEQGTPVGEVVKDDKEAEKNLPKVMRDAMSKQNGPTGSRSFSTSVRRRLDTMASSEPPSNDPALDYNAAVRERDAEETSVSAGSVLGRRAPEKREDQDYPGQWYEIDDNEAAMIARREIQGPEAGLLQAQAQAQLEQGLKFAEPTVPREKQRHLRRRYQSIVEQVTNMIMKHGMKAKAQKHMSEIMTHLRTAAPPKPSEKRLLPLPTSVARLEDLPRNPIVYLTYALDCVAPLLRIRSLRGLAGGGMALQLPEPLPIRNRRRTAIVWILEAVEKRKGATSSFPKRFGEELVSIVEGKSGVWTKREQAHRMAIAGRANIAIAAKAAARRR